MKSTSQQNLMKEAEENENLGTRHNANRYNMNNNSHSDDKKPMDSTLVSYTKNMIYAIISAFFLLSLFFTLFIKINTTIDRNRHYKIWNESLLCWRKEEQNNCFINQLVPSIHRVDEEHDDDDHIVSTVLSVFDGTTNQFVSSENNTLYKLFQNSQFLVPDNGKDDYGWVDPDNNHHDHNLYSSIFNNFDIQLKLNKKSMSSFHEPLQLSWSHSKLAKDNTNYKYIMQNLVNEEDILALYCQSSSTDMKRFKSIDFSKPRDAATIAQAKSTSHYFHPQQRLDDNTWYIKSFPTIREENCHFRLWREYHPNQIPIPIPVVLDSSNSHSNSGDSLTTKPKLILLATSDDINLPSLDTPTGIHLSLTTNPTEIVVQFITGSKYRKNDMNNDIYNDDDNVPIVEVVHPNNTVTVYLGNTTSYTNDDMCQYPANSNDVGCFISPGNLHTVLLDNLIPDTEYKYRVGLQKSFFLNNEDNHNIITKNGDVKGRPYSSSYFCYNSQEYHSFVTAPTIGSNNPYAFIAYGDQGCPLDGKSLGGNMSAAMVQRELDNAIDIPIRAVHHFGDLSYARGHAHLWDDWLDMISIFSTRVPLLVGVGNHEYDHTAGGKGKDPSGVDTDDGFRPIWGNFWKDSGGECGVPTSKRFYVPQTGNGVFWYSYDLGLVHTIMISSEHALDKKSRQYKWLEHDLKSVNRDVTPWVIVESHRPMYMSGSMTSGQFFVEKAMRKEFEYLLQKYNVDLFLAGHFHSYLRTCSGLYKSKCHNGGPTHITVGTAGAKLRTHHVMEKKWAEVFYSEWGYGKVIVYNSTNIHWNFISSHEESEGKVLDEVWITKER